MTPIKYQRSIAKFQKGKKIRTISHQEAELNKRKQQFLRMNGVNVEVNGSWGPWQEKKYRELTTKDKHYNTTPLGLLQYGWDKLMGNPTTYREEPEFVTGKPTATITADTRSPLRRKIEQSVNDPHTPLGYVTQVVAPSAAVAGTLVYGLPAAARALPSIAGQGVRSTVGAAANSARSFGNRMLFQAPGPLAQVAGGTTVQTAIPVTVGDVAMPLLTGAAAAAGGYALSQAGQHSGAAVLRAEATPTDSTTTAAAPVPTDSTTTAQPAAPQPKKPEEEEKKTEKKNHFYTKPLHNLGRMYKMGAKGATYIIGSSPFWGTGLGIYLATRDKETPADSVMRQQEKQMIELNKLSKIQENQQRIDSLNNVFKNRVAFQSQQQANPAIGDSTARDEVTPETSIQPTPNVKEALKAINDSILNANQQ